MGETHSKEGKSKGFPKLAKKNLITRWKTRNLPQQFFGVARHDERADGMNSFYNGAIWVQTDDFRNWPFDPPLSDAGLEAARDTGQRMKDIAQSSSNQLHVIVSSPYFRCVQTAVEICLALGPKTRLLVDYSLGEIFGPTVMGPTVPQNPVRPMAHTLSYCRSRGVSIHPRVIGKWPTWPENIRDARERFANLFLTYLQRANTTRRNFLIVGHADCVAASLSLMPSQADHSIEKIHYGGLFLGKRFRKEEKKLRKPKKIHRKQLVSIVPGDENIGDSDPDSPTLLLGNRSCHDGWLTGDDPNEEACAMFEEKVDLPSESDGWEVLTMNIDLHKKLMQRTTSSGSSHSTFSKRVSDLAKKSRFSRERIEQLLGELSSSPLGDVAREELAREFIARQTSAESDDRVSTRQSLVSFSTFLFGASDIGNSSDLGNSSDIASRAPTWPSEINSRRPSAASDAGSRLPSATDLESCPNLSPRASVRNSGRLSTHPRMAKSMNGSPVDGCRRVGDSPVDSQSPKTFLEDQGIPSRSSQQRVSSRSLERVDEKNGPAGFSLIANEPIVHSSGSDMVNQKAGLHDIIESSLWRRRQMQSALSNNCLASPAQLENNIEKIAVSVPAQHATQRLDVEQTMHESITQLRSAVQVQSFQAIPA